MPVIHMHQAPKGWEQNPDYVYIGRGKGAIWGNPFSHQIGTLAKFRVHSREVAVQKHREWLLNNPVLLARLPELKGKILICWCKQNGKDISCHGDVLHELANKE